MNISLIQLDLFVLCHTTANHVSVPQHCQLCFNVTIVHSRLLSKKRNDWFLTNCMDYDINVYVTITVHMSSAKSLESQDGT